MKLRHVAVASLAAVAASVGVGATAASATVTPAQGCVDATFTTHVVNRPDSSSHGDWAKDNFTRTTVVKCTVGGAQVSLIDSGTFTPLPGALSPAAGVPIHNLPFSGQFSGGTSFTVKTTAKAADPVLGASGKFSSSEWIKLVFPKGEATQQGWQWTYKHCGQTWVNAAGGNSGDITGEGKCPVPPKHTYTPKPPVTTTVTPAPTTVVPPVNVPVKVTVNPGQFVVTPNTSKGVDTGDGSLS
jgi:hypothetical protein